MYLYPVPMPVILYVWLLLIPLCLYSQYLTSSHAYLSTYYLFVYLYPYTRVCISSSVPTYLLTSVHVSVSLSLYVSLTYLHIYLYPCTYIYTYLLYIFIFLLSKCIPALDSICLTHISIYLHPNHTYVRTYLPKYTSSYKFVCTYAHIATCTYVHVYISTCPRTHYPLNTASLYICIPTSYCVYLLTVPTCIYSLPLYLCIHWPAYPYAYTGATLSPMYTYLRTPVHIYVLYFSPYVYIPHIYCSSCAFVATLHLFQYPYRS